MTPDPQELVDMATLLIIAIANIAGAMFLAYFIFTGGPE